MIPVFPHYRMSLARPGGNFPTCRGSQLGFELSLYGVAGISNPALVLFDTITRHTNLLTPLTSHTINFISIAVLS
jgi:hypothetical protein